MTEARGRQRIVVGNWKCNKSLDRGRQWLDRFASRYRPFPGLRVIVAPPMIWLAHLQEHVRRLGLQSLALAAQDVSPFPAGGYTGAIAADMLKGLAEYAIVGHPERRRYFHETSQDVTNKVSEAAEAGISPIVCVDKTYAMSQLTAVNDVDCQDLVVAYCPEAPRNYPEPEAVDRVEEAVRFLADIPHPPRPIIYGGAITPANAERYASITGLSGLFVGAASLDADAFADVCGLVGGAAG